MLALLLLMLSVAVHAQQYMIFFTDKNNTAYSIDNPQAFLSERALARRAKNNVSVTEQDFPVNATYVQQLRDAGAVVQYTTRWMNGALVSCDASLLSALTALDFVSGYELVVPASSGSRVTTIDKFEAENTTTTLNATQNNMLALDIMHADGYRGEGVVIAVFDGGFNNVNTGNAFTHIFNDSRFNAEASFDFKGYSGNVFQYHHHGANVLSIIAAVRDGEYTGAAPNAEFQLYVTENVSYEYRIEEYNWLFAAERADSAGADIINSSLGYYYFDDPAMDYTKAQMDGETPVITRAAELAVQRGILVVTSAGNEGNNAWGIITAPADGEHVLAVGSITSSFAKSTFSSVGPTADGRIKPDVVAMGSGTTYISTAGTISTGSGTSYSAPIVTGLAAGLIQKYPELTVYQIMDTIKLKASQAANPDNQLGYGIPRYTDVITSIDTEPLQLKLYPNPVTDKLTIQGVDATVQLHIVNTMGVKQPVQALLENERVTVDFKSFAAGIYMITVQQGTRTKVFRVFKSE